MFIPPPSSPAPPRSPGPRPVPPRPEPPRGFRPGAAPAPGPATRPYPGRPGGPVQPRPGGPDGPVPGGPGGPGGPGRRAPRLWYKRLRWKRIGAIFAVFLLVVLLGSWWYANTIFNRIEKVDVTAALGDGSGGTNYLIVGSDSAEVLDESNPAFDPARPAGQRSDTIMLLRFADGKAKMLSIPRDLWVTNAATGENGRINGTYNQGPANLINTISQNLGIPIHRYIEVDFVSFAGLVDGLGGVTIEFPHPARDPKSGLNVTQSGQVELDGQQALAYVRSRNYIENVDGREVTDPTGDLGRITRQQAFLRAVFSKLSHSNNPWAMARTASNVSKGLRIDDDMSLWNAIQFAWRLRGLQPEPLKLEVTNERKGGAAVLVLQEEASKPVLDQFRGEG
ncbi:MAG TPA: LCP family protein [Acidimicrobiales bacterium]